VTNSVLKQKSNNDYHKPNPTLNKNGKFITIIY